ncbi:hypothetical protein TIFTF001_031712 [Ficus carica]|uniref:Uncharacterized protein n=1 Tax=Ficus carica TaxID=3494 RepID=A0AA88J6P3_FICCA|nr:hypothetical protein TIFTF001_031712 [Ficus carica]
MNSKPVGKEIGLIQARSMEIWLDPWTSTEIRQLLHVFGDGSPRSVCGSPTKSLEEEIVDEVLLELQRRRSKMFPILLSESSKWRRRSSCSWPVPGTQASVGSSRVNVATLAP